MTTAERLARYEDLFDLPDNVVGEIIAGRLLTHPRPAPAHARASSVLGNKVGTAFDQGEGGPGGWWIFDEPELHLSQDILVPDLAGWRRERMPALPKTAWFDMTPDWVCEVLSPATARTDRVLKLPRYAAAGVAHCWLIDPDARTLEAYANQGGRWLLLGTWGGDDVATVDPFAAIPLSLGPMGGLTMRLSPEQIAQIRQSAAEGFGPKARVWLFGSRVDDRKLGGDIDLLVESDRDLPVQALLRTQARMEYALPVPVDMDTLTAILERFEAVCHQYRLLPAADGRE